MKLAFYKAPGTLMDRIVRWWTHGEFSHVELVTADAGIYMGCWSSSPRDGGIRFKLIPKDNDKWVLVDIGMESRRDRDRVHNWFVRREAAPYDWLGLLAFVFRPFRGSTNRWVCSRACAEALGFADAWRYDPNTLHSLAMTLVDSSTM